MNTILIFLAGTVSLLAVPGSFIFGFWIASKGESHFTGFAVGFILMVFFLIVTMKCVRYLDDHLG